ncbi:hypothetical protein DV736_g4552, partial [Chaetothyriales sp. CBS 134916]
MGIFQGLTTLLSIVAFATVAFAANATNGATVQSTILIFARDADAGASATSGLNGYGIPFELILVPQSGITLPTLENSAGGLYGGIIAEGQLSYNYGTNGTENWQSAITADQWNTLYTYQTTYGVRMVQYNVYPQPMFGTTVVNTGGCCDSGVEQLFTFTDTSAFPQAGIYTGQGVSTKGLWHYNSQITDSNTTTEIAQFGPGGGYDTTTAAVINNFSGREQIVFFLSWATNWSATSSFLQHAYITWLTRGLYTGYRRVNFITQIDDMFLETQNYLDQNVSYHVTPEDMNQIKSWIPNILAKMNTGSVYVPEVGFNGNGNINDASDIDWDICTPGPIWYDPGPANTPMEFEKPLGTGIDWWPDTPTTYDFSTSCIKLDTLEQWWSTPSNRDAFLQISHTFTHLNLDNATYSDALKEIQFNQAWFNQTGIGGNAATFSAGGLIPPAITGLHNGDVLRAWRDAGLNHCVGDSSRVALLNSQNNMWPYTTNTAADGFDGYTIIPRWPTRIYYDCDTPNCTLAEWINTSAGSGTFQDLLNAERADTTRYLFALNHAGYMFHQLNLRTQGLPAITYNGVTANVSLFQAWVETIVEEFTRLVNWPLITVNQDDLATLFRARQARDSCAPQLSYTINNNQITAITVSANGNTCSEAIPFTLPTTVTNTAGLTSEKIGNDPQTYWTTLSGSAQTFTLTTPVSL